MNSESSSASAASDRSTGPATTDQAGSDWTDQVADLVVDTVDKIRSKTTGPIQNVLQAVAYVLIALIVAIPMAIAFFAGTIRLLDWAIPGDVWIAYSILAVILWLVGLILWSRRKPVP
jgi:hypothetical protein